MFKTTKNDTGPTTPVVVTAIAPNGSIVEVEDWPPSVGIGKK